MGAEHTSIPRWAAEVPAADPAARAVALLGFGSAGAQVVAEWRQQVRTGTDVWSRLASRADDATLAELEEQVRAARVGWRLMLAGPEADVLAARSLAVRCGLLDAELRTAVTDAGRKRVFCAHCRTTTEQVLPVAAVVECPGCGRRLHVYAHVSRRLGAYLGFMVDAEEVA